MDPVLNFIGGAFVPAQSGATLTTVNPATGDVITTLPKSSTSDVEAATTAALQAASAWSATTMEERIAWLHRIADALEEDRESVAQLESTDTGKPIALARRVDAARSVANFRFFAEFGAQHSDPTFTDHGAINHLHRSPIGCVGLITPWNLPLYLLSWKVAPALLMGNTIVAKPSELTPLTANHLAVVMQRIGFPDGVFNLVHGLGPDVGQAIVEHPDIRGVSFTGGTATGKIVAATAAPMFKKLSLELGGKNATVVLDDAPLDEIMDGLVRASFTNSGQVCLCGSRILVDASIYASFKSKFTEAVESITVGNPSEEHTSMGSVISHDHRDKVESYIRLAVEEGGRVLTGGTSGDAPVEGVSQAGAFLRPTVIEGL
ncbi:MAG: aldehyde dehydrogenase family protein, partial [Poseidonia sp.]